MDLKILAAVFTTLAAVFVAMNAGGLSAPDSGTGLQGLLPGFLSPEPAQPETPVSADIQVLTDNTTMTVNGNVTIQGLTQYLSDDVDIQSDNDIEFKNFEGDLTIGNDSKISGTAEGFTSNGVQVARNFRLEEELNTSLIEIEGVETVGLEFERADIDLQSTNSSGITESNKSVSIETFTGNITVRPGEMGLSLDGNISTVEAGQTTFGN